MSVRISWTNSREYDSIRIYRSESKIELDNLPVPITEVAGNATFYVDILAKDNVIYYYLLGKVDSVDGIERYSQNKTFGNFPRTGHGPTRLRQGNWNKGYFGKVEAVELFDVNEMTEAFNERLLSVDPTAQPMTLTNTSGVPRPTSHWHKFIHNGKILFIPDSSVAGTFYWNGNYGYYQMVGWLMLYKMGAVFGTDGPGTPPDGVDPVPQDFIITREGYKYRVRLMRCTDGSLGDVVSSELFTNQALGEFALDKSSDIFNESEYFGLYNSLFKESWIPSKGTRLSGDRRPIVGAASDMVLCQELLEDEETLKGITFYKEEFSKIDHLKDTDNAAVSVYAYRDGNYFPTHALQAGVCWRPVLELIFEDEVLE